jgi:20S proteasome subunit alpha 6
VPLRDLPRSRAADRADRRASTSPAAAALLALTTSPPLHLSTPSTTHHSQSKTHAVLAALKRAPSELAAHQRKVFRVDDHVGAAISGLTADGRVLCRYMRAECLNHRYVYEAPLPVGRLTRAVSDRAQVGTQRSWKRPYGVGLLVAGADAQGAHVVYNCPSGNAYAYKAFAMGARSQAARTYLERHFEGFEAASADELARHALRALRATLQDGELTEDNCTLAVVSADAPFVILEGAALAPYLEAAAEEDAGEPGGGGGEGGGGEGGGGEGGGGEGGGGGGGAAPMEAEGA